MKKDMTEGREWSSILLFSLPIMGANLLQVLYNLADSVIVGNLISATALGAVGLTSSMTWLLTAICTSIGAGVNIAVAQYFGAKKETDIQESISVSYLIAVIASIFLTAACFLAARPVIFGFLQAPEEMRFDSMAYFLIYSSGIIFQLLYLRHPAGTRGFARRTHFPDDLRRPEHRAGLCVYLRLSYGCLRRGCRDRDRTGRFRHRQFPVSAAHFPGSAAETALSLRLEGTGGAADAPEYSDHATDGRQFNRLPHPAASHQLLRRSQHRGLRCHAEGRTARAHPVPEL